MSRLSRTRTTRSAPQREQQTAEHTLTVPDALLAWAREPAQALRMPRQFAAEVDSLLRAPQPLTVEQTDVLLNRLEPIASLAVRDKRHDLLTGLDLQTAEWLGLTFVHETERGTMTVGPDPRSQAFAGAPEPEWTYAEVRAVVDAAEGHLDAAGAVQTAARAKAMLREVFGAAADERGYDEDGHFSEGGRDLAEARIGSVASVGPLACLACAKTLGRVSLTTDAGSYCMKCWSELASPMPEHLAKILRNAPKARET